MSSVTFAGSRTLRSNAAATNENAAAAGKNFVGGPRAKAGQAQPLLGRAALGNLANQNPLKGKDASSSGMPEKKGMTKQKALGNLLQATALPPAKSTRSSTGTHQRKSSEGEEAKPMDIDALPAAPVGGLDMALAPVVDIDQEDAENPQLVGEYVNDIYAYMRHLEREQSILADYLKGKKTAIKPKMRNLMVDWLVEVHTQFSLLQETLYLTVAILDRYVGGIVFLFGSLSHF